MSQKIRWRNENRRAAYASAGVPSSAERASTGYCPLPGFLSSSNHSQFAIIRPSAAGLKILIIVMSGPPEFNRTVSPTLKLCSAILTFSNRIDLTGVPSGKLANHDSSIDRRLCRRPFNLHSAEEPPLRLQRRHPGRISESRAECHIASRAPVPAPALRSAGEPVDTAVMTPFARREVIGVTRPSLAPTKPKGGIGNVGHAGTIGRYSCRSSAGISREPAPESDPGSLCLGCRESVQK
jgi:hypothetical protein